MKRESSLRSSGPWMALPLVVLFVLATTFTTLPTLAQTAPPTLSVSPTSGVVGEQITLFGSNFFPGPGSVLWDNKEVAQVTIPQSVSFTVPFTVPLQSALGIHTVTLCGVSCTAQSASATFRVDEKLSNLPIDMRRRAAQFLEEMRSGPLAPGWENARLSDVVRPLYRPDMTDPAYYELLVLVPLGLQNAPDAVAIPRPGFIILSTGEHDSPIAHWNYTGFSPTQELEILAASNQQPQIAKFYKLDTLAYAGEDAQGNRVAYLGTELTKIGGQNTSMLDQKVDLTEQNWQPDKQTSNDGTPPISGTLVITGPQPLASITLSGWGSWNELKSGYAQSYATQLESQRRLASGDWQVENHARQIGEALRKGNTYTYALLATDVPTTTLSGQGASLVQTKVLTRTGLPSEFQITVINSVPLKDVPFDVTVKYSDGNQEVMKFVVIEPATHFIYLPSVVRSTATQQMAKIANTPLGTQGDWGPWTYFWAGTDADQRLYRQMNANTPPNTSSCYSGCGGTAWAMLFGWADNQAANGNGYWAPRNGLYRQNGGYGADAVAPRTADTGVNNMTWEIRNRIGTFCAFGSGATPPWSMGNASGYLAGRSGTRLDTHYDVLGIHEDRLREYARNSIRDRGTPAIIGTGWLTHYPLAYGYAWRSRETQACFICPWTTTEYSRWFYVNQGWGGAGNGWVSAGTWFAGEIYP